MIDLAGRNPKFCRPVLIESKASRAMLSSQMSSPCGARERHAKGLQGVVAKRFRLLASDRKGVRDAPRSAPICPTGRGHVDSRTVADSRIPARKQGNQSFVLAQSDARQAPNAAVGRSTYAKARARYRGVMRPRIVFKGIEKPGQFREQLLVPVLKLAAQMKRRRQELAILIEIDASENRLNASLEGGEVLAIQFGAT
jgi:hypothetical protein